MKKIIFTLVFINLLTLNLFCQDTLKIELIKDINSSLNNSSFPRNIVILNNNLIFTAYDSTNDQALWISDGTDNGTHLLKKPNTGENYNNHIDELTIWNDKIVFEAKDDVHGIELWITDGTYDNTKMIKDINPNNPYFSLPENSEPGGFYVYNNKVFFHANYLSNTQLFVTDGTDNGTVALTNNKCPIQIGFGLVGFKNKVFFSNQTCNQAYSQLWVTNGMPDSTNEFKIFSIGSNCYLKEGFPSIVYKNKLYFTAGADSIGMGELWVSDGTSSGTVLFKDINLIVGQSSYPSEFEIYNNNLYFFANDGIHGQELWCTNGDSTYLVKDIFLNDDSFYYDNLINLNNKLFFTAYNKYGNTKLFMSNGTADSTIEIVSKDSSSIINPHSFVEWKGKIIFIAGDYSKQLWITDGTQRNTYPIFPDSLITWETFDQSILINFKDDIYLNAKYNDSIGNELYKLTIDSNKIRPNIIQQPKSASICIGDSVMFDIKVSGRPDFTFQWFKNNIPIQNANNSSCKISNVFISDTGYYYCIIKNSVGEIKTDSVSLNVLSKLPSCFEVIDSTQHGFYYIKYTGNFPKIANYIWNFDGGQILSGYGQGPYNVAWQDSGQKKISLNVSLNNCVSDTCKIFKTVTAISNIISLNVVNSIYPNPTTDNIIIDCSEKENKLYIYNLLGELVFQKLLSNRISEINVSNLQTGIYVIKIENEQGTIQQKLIIK